MSLYNMLMGFNPSCVVIMPMLGRKQDEWPRFRDCFVTEEKNIAIYTRVGGGNRNCGYGEEELYKDPNFIKTYDDDYDSTYATYEFRVPEKWKNDFDVIVEGNLKSVSDEYYNYVCEFYPVLNEKGVLKKIFQRDWENSDNV